MSEELAKHLSFFVPHGFLLMKQSEIDRIHNESEARYIERNDARAEVDRLREAILRHREHRQHVGPEWTETMAAAEAELWAAVDASDAKEPQS